MRASEPYDCAGNNDLEIRGRVIETDGNGVEIRGNCDVEIIDSRIVAGGVGILVLNNGDVSIENSHVEGAVAAIALEHLGEANYRRSTIRGDIRVGPMADVEDRGGNDVAGRVTSGPGARSGGSPGRVQIGDIVISDDGVRIGSGASGIEVTDEGVIVGSGESGVEVTEGGVRVGSRDEVVVGDDGSVRVESGGTTVITEGDYVRIEDGNSTTTVTGAWREGGSSTYSGADTDRILVDLGATTQGKLVELNLAGDVLFDFGSGAVRPEAGAQLRKVAHVLRQRAAGEIHVVGHTDSVGGADQNQKLSEARAIAVMRWLNENEAIPLALMRGQGLGATEPLRHNTNPDGSDNPEGRAQNRRVEVRFTQ
jgi:outer membrane protein OmpA-like peptidoglycan-associated protein